MKLSEFDYNLPKNLIAQEPMKPRDHSRLLILDKQNGKLEHKKFYNIIEYFKKGDVLVMNNSKVFPARLIGKRKESGGKVEVFLLRSRGRDVALQRLHTKAEVWQCLIGGRRIKEGLVVEFEQGLEGKVIKNNQDGTYKVEFNMTEKKMMQVVEKIGQTPLPPYIKRIRNQESRIKNQDKISYQTVYADESKIGSVAAPTAGFHFTPKLIQKLKDKGVRIEYITLHVGLGTFAPVKTDDITKHKMHAEFVEASAETIAKIYLAKHEGRRVIAVGTTSVRTLEAIASQFSIFNFQFSITEFNKQFKNFNKFVNIFIYPGYKFKIVDAMITNFHLPKSTLLILVSAMAGKENIKKAYKGAIKLKYRFYSYGDSMFIK
ncbi:tRNA preQ1(34) S-adenosylmethionine ribosyltransferase-isomerase QueA [bacterium]|nr:tRNA preQ1(34) S-adenosylmethionine ribosyltransferase-isomerase QueA [bacterium]